MELPKHVAIILDGNRRWAKERNLPTLKGHQMGAKNIKTLALDIFKKGITYLSIFAFSTENFKRSQEEVDYLMNLFVKEFKTYCKDLNKNNIKIIFSGRKYPLKPEVLNMMDEITSLTKDNTGGVLNVCLNYGGRSEIVDTSIKIANLIKENKLNIEDINEELFSANLYQKLPDIDLVIRTSGESRISNFMLWQMSYAELFFTNTYFPDFKIKEFNEILEKYSKRERRFGGNNEKKSN